MDCKECKENFEQIVAKIHCPRCYKYGRRKYVCRFWERQRNTIQHEALYRYNDKRKDYFKQYKLKEIVC